MRWQYMDFCYPPFCRRFFRMGFMKPVAIEGHWLFSIFGHDRFRVLGMDFHRGY